jgi:hypothetical protein
MTRHGGCLCGRIRFEIRGDAHQVYLCHCRQCQQAQGAAFVAALPMPASDFVLLTGADSLKCYRATPAKARCFCAECGSPIYSCVDGAAELRLRVGTLDDCAELAVAAQIFTSTRVAWLASAEAAPAYPAKEPGRG